MHRFVPDDRGRATAATAAVALLLLLTAGYVHAGTTGKLVGLVVDYNETLVPGAVVALQGTSHMALTESGGDFDFIGVPAGVYRLQVTKMGYVTVLVRQILVSADQTTRVKIELPSTDVVVDRIEVIATRPVVDLNLTGSMSVITSAEIQELPVQELQDIVKLQAGVVEGHFRGGRSGEVQWQVDGISVNNPFDNSMSLRIDRSLLDEVQVVSGTFDAEYGQAMSGVVNTVLKTGTRSFHWSAEAFTGGFLLEDAENRRLTTGDINPAAIQNYQVTLSGPVVHAKTVYLLNIRRYLFDEQIEAERLFVPTDSADFEQKIFNPTGDGKKEPLGYSREWSGAVKITNTSIPKLKLNYQAVFNRLEGRMGDFGSGNFDYRCNPDGMTIQETNSIVHGLDLTHTLNKTTFYTLTVRQNYFDYKDYVYGDVFDPRYDAAGQPMSDDAFEPGAIIQGVDLTRWKQKTNTRLIKGSLISQVHPEHMFKVGGELAWPRVQFGTPGHLAFATVDGEQTLVRHIDEPPDYPGITEYRPVTGAAFAQDQIEWDDLTLRAGLRFDYFDARAMVPSDLSNPANSISGVPRSEMVETGRKAYLSPRLGLAYPVGDRAAIHIAYGHFIQFPAIGEIFSNADYSILNDLQAGGIDYGVMGNPDIKPEQTVQYEFGYKHAITDDLGADLTLFYKDIRDLLGVEFISTYNAAEYARLTNVDFGNVIGVTLSIDRRRVGMLRTSLDYTWQTARGNSSDPRETATRAEAGEDARPRRIPFDWDQQHTFNLTASLEQPQNFNVSGVLRMMSGTPYTPVIESGFGYGLEKNSDRKLSSTIVDIRAEKKVAGIGGGGALFARVFNLFDARFSNGHVFATSGSPYYSRFPIADSNVLANPTRFYPARRVEIGFKIGSGV